MKINSIGGFEHIKNGTRKNQALQFRLEIRFERQMNRMENGDKKKQKQTSISPRCQTILKDLSYFRKRWNPQESQQ